MGSWISLQLKCRLERMERRMSLLKQKSPAVTVGAPLGRDDLDVTSAAPAHQHHVRAINFSACAGSDAQPRGHKRSV